MITISPENPSSTDSIVLTVTGSGCIINTTIIDNNPIFIAEISEDEGCFTTPPEYSYNLNIGTLTSGEYTFIHRLNDFSGVEKLTEQIIVNVSQEPSSISPTPVPTTSALSLLILTTLLFAVGKRYFKK